MESVASRWQVRMYERDGNPESATLADVRAVLRAAMAGKTPRVEIIYVLLGGAEHTRNVWRSHDFVDHAAVTYVLPCTRLTCDMLAECPDSEWPMAAHVVVDVGSAEDIADLTRTDEHVEALRRHDVGISFERFVRKGVPHDVTHMATLCVPMPIAHGCFSGEEEEEAGETSSDPTKVLERVDWNRFSGVVTEMAAYAQHLVNDVLHAPPEWPRALADNAHQAALYVIDADEVMRGQLFVGCEGEPELLEELYRQALSDINYAVAVMAQPCATAVQAEAYKPTMDFGTFAEQQRGHMLCMGPLFPVIPTEGPTGAEAPDGTEGNSLAMRARQVVSFLQYYRVMGLRFAH